MDISSFVNSRDIKKYHRDIGYKYNALEAAWLVSQCHGKTLEEKHQAWHWIIDNMPDMEIANCGRWVSEKGDTVHKVLADYMEMEKAFIERFKDASGGWLYTYKSYCRSLGNGRSSYDWEGFFTSFDNCLKDAYETIEAEDSDIVVIERQLPDEGYKAGDVVVDLFGRIQSVTTDYSKEDNENRYYLGHFFDELWFDFPVPFKRGDIVYIKNKYHPDEHTPIVLDSILVPSVGDKEEFIKKRREHGDTSDMDIWGYAADVEWCNGYNGIYNDTWWNYMDAEYYREELTGFNRLLKPISNWLKGELGDDLVLMLSGYHHIMMEEYLSRTVPALYTKEGLKMAGFPAEGVE